MPGREEIRLLLAEQLELDAAEIGFDDDLVELGLHSMKMIKLAADWRREGADVSFADLAQRPSVQGWYELLAQRAQRPSDEGARTRRAPVRQADSPEAEGTPFGLATMQHGYWIGRADDQELGGVAAHLYAEFDGSGVDPRRLEQAVAKLVHRHGMLRSQFLDDGTQRVLPEPGVPVWTVYDLRSQDEDGLRERLEQIRAEKTHQRMRADLGQVLDVSLTLLPQGRTRVHVDVDMLAADALSYRILMDDLARFYRDPDREPAPLSYDYRRYLRDHAEMNAAAREREQQWWQEVLPELPDPPDLPLVPESERADPLRTVRFEHWLDPHRKNRLLDRAHKHGVTPAMVLAAVFAEVVGMWSGQQRFLLNLPLFNREPTHPDVESLVGDFSSSVLVDVDLTAPDTVLGRARGLQQQLHARAAHAAYPGLDVLRDLGRFRGEPVLANVVYTSGLNLGELFADSVIEAFGPPVWIISQGPQVVLDAQVVELDGGLLLNWDVREQAFPPGMMAAMFARHHEIIDDLLSDGSDWNLPFREELPQDQAEVRREVNDTSRPVSARLLHEGFFTWAADSPDAPALVWGQGRSLSYGELGDRALRVAGALRSGGVGAGDAVSVQLPKGPEQVIAVLGVLAAGAAYVPIGAEQPDARRDRIRRTAGVVLSLEGRSRPAGEDGVPVLAVGEAMEHPRPLEEPVRADPESVAYVLFTSGSTGEPKGVEVTHSAAMNTIDCLNERYGVNAGDRSCALSALEFDLSVYDMFGLLSVGGSVLMVEGEAVRDGQRMAEAVRAGGVTLLNCVPGLLDMVLAAAGPHGLGRLRAVVVGGDRVGVDLPGRLRAVAPGCRFAGLGGTTETAIHSTVCEVDGEADPQWRSVPYGVPLGNVRCRVVNERGADCPDWVPGELWIGGRGVAKGYRGDPERTADRFVEYEGLRWYRTGDLARYRPDGTIEFLGRRDHQVKIRGHRVELGEVEAALNAFPAVHRAVAAAVGEGALKLAAAVTLEEEADSEAILDSAARLLPSYMVPERLRVLPQMPLTGNGKLDRAAVRALLENGAVREQDHVAPADSLETVLADIVGEVLRSERVGVEHDFFLLGGDSVLATTVVARVRERLDTDEVTVADLFAGRTVRGLAERLAARQRVQGRLEQAADVYLLVRSMSDEEVLADS